MVRIQFDAHDAERHDQHGPDGRDPRSSPTTQSGTIDTGGRVWPIVDRIVATST
jgi:hypothetical protein